MSLCSQAVERVSPRTDWPRDDWPALLERFLDELEKWNRSIQMVRFHDRRELAERHVGDAAVVAAHLLASGVVEGRAIDVGCGGGLPGAVVAALLPSLSVVALEPVHKKHAFLAHVGRTLPLPNLTARAQRDEDHDPGDGYDVAMSRAVWSAPEWLERAPRLLRPGGLVVAMEGKQRAELPVGARRSEYRLGDRQRALILWRPGISLETSS